MGDLPVVIELAAIAGILFIGFQEIIGHLRRIADALNKGDGV